MILKGKVKSGLGNANYWVRKIQKIFDEKMKITLFAGTLNIELDNPYKIQNILIKIQGQEYGGTEEVLVEECKVLGNKSFIVRTGTNETGNGDHPLTIIEIISDINFREKYNLKDGDKLEIII